MKRIAEKVNIEGYGTCTLTQALGQVYKKYYCKWIYTVQGVTFTGRSYSITKLGQSMNVLAPDIDTAIDYVTKLVGTKPSIVKRI